MPTGTAFIDIQTSPEAAFDLIHDYRRRLDWDPFLREANLLNGAAVADRGVTSRCISRRNLGGWAMDTVYVTFDRPTVAAVKMTRGPFFFRSFAASIRQSRIDEQTTRVTYRYNFQLRPSSLAWFIGPFVWRTFDRETHARLAALKRYLEAERSRR